MQVSDVMTKQVRTIQASDTLAEAASVMQEENIGSLPVCNGEQVIGMLTDRDIVVRAVACGLDPVSTTVAVAMTPKVTRCFADLTVSEANRVMEDEGVRRLVVTNRQNQMVGLLSYDDLAVLPPQELTPAAGAPTEPPRVV
jgi:CBS domain-containing protein